jgi:hypothetical protein
MLIGWKRIQERAYRTRLTSSINLIGHAELEVAARALMSSKASSTTSTAIITPKEKIKKNGLQSCEFLLNLGAAKSHEVEQVLRNAAQLDADFPARLKQGFVSRYKECIREGYENDDLFYALYDWAGGGGQDRQREAAGLCVLSHLFVICDIFEK